MQLKAIIQTFLRINDYEELQKNITNYTIYPTKLYSFFKRILALQLISDLAKIL